MGWRVIAQVNEGDKYERLCRSADLEWRKVEILLNYFSLLHPHCDPIAMKLIIFT